MTMHTIAQEGDCVLSEWNVPTSNGNGKRKVFQTVALQTTQKYPKAAIICMLEALGKWAKPTTNLEDPTARVVSGIRFQTTVDLKTWNMDLLQGIRR